MLSPNAEADIASASVRVNLVLIVATAHTLLGVRSGAEYSQRESGRWLSRDYIDKAIGLRANQRRRFTTYGNQ